MRLDFYREPGLAFHGNRPHVSLSSLLLLLLFVLSLFLSLDAHGSNNAVKPPRSRVAIIPASRPRPPARRSRGRRARSTLLAHQMLVQAARTIRVRRSARARERANVLRDELRQQIHTDTHARQVLRTRRASIALTFWTYRTLVTVPLCRPLCRRHGSRGRGGHASKIISPPIPL